MHKAPASPFEGQCSCGAIRYELLRPPLFVHACHCLKCQKHSGSVFGITIIVLEADIKVRSGRLNVVPMAESPHRSRHVCAVCDDHLYTTATNHPGTALLRSGTLDDPRVIHIDAHIWTCRKRSWLVLPDDIPQFEEGYDPATAWPKESLLRLERATAKGV